MVVGSLNRDLVVTAETLPLPGETVLGRSYSQHNGGKGANQAVALARLGRHVSMVGSVGSDDDGVALVAALREEGVGIDAIATTSSHTGVAAITVDDRGENSIVVVPGANGDLDPATIDTFTQLIASSDIVLTQLEVPVPSVERAISHASGIVVLNPAPAAVLGSDLLASVDYLVPNRTELATLAGTDSPETADQLLQAVTTLDFDGVVVVTLGSEGAIAVRNGLVVARATPPRVDVVDTVGAGDAFCAGLCDALSRGSGLQQAVEWAVACGALATTRQGAQPSMPTASEVRTLVEQA